MAGSRRLVANLRGDVFRFVNLAVATFAPQPSVRIRGAAEDPRWNDAGFHQHVGVFHGHVVEDDVALA